MRIDKAVSPPGWIKGAECFSLFCDSRGLFAIKTGRGWRIGYSPSGLIGATLGQAAVDAVVGSIKKSITEVEHNLNPANLDGEVRARKGSVFLPWSEVSEVTVKTRHNGLPELAFKGGSKKYRFQFEQGRDAEVEAFSNSWPRR
ncbi:MAG: hypothetical protein RMJ98_19385 [Myxococcales bacterium]|nr:hypothetical protein [Polyangiaceae bacterium]MDW8251463.1 hypothetical protein [Myxococcales bacterium]